MNNYTIIDNNLITSNISDGAYRLYTLLLSMAYGDKNTCYPSQVYLSEKLHKSIRTIQRYLNELISAKLIAKRRRGSISNIYTLIAKKVQQNINKALTKAKNAYNKKFNKNSNSSYFAYQGRNYDFNELEQQLLGYKTYNPMELLKE